MDKKTKNLMLACSVIDNLSALLTTLELINDTTTLTGQERQRLVRNVIDMAIDYTNGVSAKLNAARDMLDNETAFTAFG